MSETNVPSSANFEKLKLKLRELFELDKADLDFGIYRILHQRHREITEFCLVGEICGSPIHSNGRRKLASRSPRTGCGIARLQAVAFRTSPVNTTPFLAGYLHQPRWPK